MTAPDTNPIELVRARLDGGRRWHKGSISDGAGNVCVVGAVRDVLGTCGMQVEVERTIGKVAVEQYRDRIPSDALMGSGTGIPAWNDHDATDWDDVETVLDKASIAWDERA